jgi:RNA polymerase sigma-70 factor
LVIDLSRRRAEPVVGSDALLDQLGSGEDLELEYLRGRFGPELQASFAAALAQLSVRQRNLLRQRHLHDISADALARLYGVHRSTVFVWLEQARVALLGHVRAALLARVPGHELDSVVGVLGSRLDLSVRRLLDSRLEPETRD